MSSPCSSCTKRCCAHYTVSITGYDAWLIGRALHLPLEAFLVYFAAADAGRGFALEPGGPRYEIALDKVGEFRRGNPCVFWVDLGGGRGRCGIYPVRPHVCQTYPAYLQHDTVMLRDDVLCPGGSWSLAGMDVPAFRDRLYRFRVEQDVYAYLVEGWNRSVERSGRGRPIRDYYAYLMNLYDRLDQTRRRLPDGALAAVVTAWGSLGSSVPNPLIADVNGDARPPGWDLVVGEIRETVDRFAAPAPPSRALVLA